MFIKSNACVLSVKVINRIPTCHYCSFPFSFIALLQYSDLWKITVRNERKILRDNVDPTEVSIYFPYLSTRVDEKVNAVKASQGRIRAMDMFIADGLLLYIGDHDWPSDLCYALKKVNQSFVAEKLKNTFLELLKSHEDTKYRKLAHYMRSEKPGKFEMKLDRPLSTYIHTYTY